MPEPDDIALLKEYAESGSEPAFTALVGRHVNLVYSAALRRAGNPHAAQEIAPAVFIILARKAKSLGDKTVLSGWLYQTARLTAANYLRGEIRRQNREREAYMQAILNEPEAEAWRQIAPLLDDAMGRLGEKDRNAIVLRFFENKNLAEIGTALGASEDAAKMRVNRALEKLRKFFTKRGVSSTTAIIAGTISTNSVQAAPVALAKTVTAVAIVKGAAVSASTLILVKGAIKTMPSIKITAVATILASAIFSQGIVASHFDAAGRPNVWMDRSTYLILSTFVGIGLPAIMIVMGYCMRFLPINRFTFKIPNRDYWLAPERRYETFDYLFRKMLWLACLEAIFLVAVQLLVVQANHQTPPHLSMPPLWGLTGGFLLMLIIWMLKLFLHFKRVP